MVPLGHPGKPCPIPCLMPGSILGTSAVTESPSPVPTGLTVWWERKTHHQTWTIQGGQGLGEGPEGAVCGNQDRQSDPAWQVREGLLEEGTSELAPERGVGVRHGTRTVSF